LHPTLDVQLECTTNLVEDLASIRRLHLDVWFLSIGPLNHA